MRGNRLGFGALIPVPSPEQEKGTRPHAWSDTFKSAFPGWRLNACYLPDDPNEKDA